MGSNNSYKQGRQQLKEQAEAHAKEVAAKDKQITRLEESLRDIPAPPPPAAIPPPASRGAADVAAEERDALAERRRRQGMLKTTKAGETGGYGQPLGGSATLGA